MKDDLMLVANQGHRQFSGTPRTARPVDDWKRAWERAMSGNESHNFVSLFAGPRGGGGGGGGDEEGGGGGGGAGSYGRFDPPSITIYRRGASGNTAPLRMIQGPK